MKLTVSKRQKLEARERESERAPLTPLMEFCHDGWHPFLREFQCIRARMRVCASVRACVCMRARVRARVCVCVCVCVRARARAYARAPET